MIEYFKLKNFMSYRDETELSFVASNKSGGKMKFLYHGTRLLMVKEF